MSGLYGILFSSMAVAKKSSTLTQTQTTPVKSQPQVTTQAPAQSVVQTGDLKVADKPPIMKKLPMKNTKGTVVTVLISLFVVLAGIGTGWFISGRSLAQTAEGPSAEISGAGGDKMEAGITDEETFKDSAEGLLLEGGIDGEGTHHLDRDLGPEKHVYLTSTVIDLESFVDKKVTVWGETVTAQKAGWLMDVGKIKVIE